MSENKESEKFITEREPLSYKSVVMLRQLSRDVVEPEDVATIPRKPLGGGTNWNRASAPILLLFKAFMGLLRLGRRERPLCETEPNPKVRNRARANSA